MQRYRAYHLNNGKIVLEEIGYPERDDRRRYAIEPSPMMIQHAELRDPVPVQEGDEGCLAWYVDVSPDAVRNSGAPINYCPLSLFVQPEGLRGNCDRNIRRLHGWRGTSNDVYKTACGWRRVEKIEKRARGIGRRITLSVDLRPDEE